MPVVGESAPSAGSRGGVGGAGEGKGATGKKKKSAIEGPSDGSKKRTPRATAHKGPADGESSRRAAGFVRTERAF